jgi:hypothetical protein
MNRKELFEKYKIEDSHDVWTFDDSWCSVEIYRIMHNGDLPHPGDKSIKWVLDFLDKQKNDMPWFVENVMSRPDWGGLFLTAKRMVCRLSEQILQEVNVA